MNIKEIIFIIFAFVMATYAIIDFIFSSKVYRMFNKTERLCNPIGQATMSSMILDVALFAISTILISFEFCFNGIF